MLAIGLLILRSGVALFGAVENPHGTVLGGAQHQERFLVPGRRRDVFDQRLQRASLDIDQTNAVPVASHHEWE